MTGQNKWSDLKARTESRRTKELILMVGLPRSGKTTMAKKLSTAMNAPIVNPDSIRLALHGQRYAAEAERHVWAAAHTMVKALFLAEHNTVILDATNTTRKRRDEWKSDQWVRTYHVIETSKEECIDRARAIKDEIMIPVIERQADSFEPIEESELADNQSAQS